MRYVLFLLALAGCSPPKSSPAEPAQPVGDAGACSGACSNLRRLGCPEGQGAISGETCERRCAVALELRAMPLDCWAAAGDVTAAKSCGQLRCIR